MSLYALLEPLILALVLLACCAACLRRFAPGSWRRLAGKSPPAAGSASCDKGCGSCGGCAPSSTPKQHLVQLSPRGPH